MTDVLLTPADVARRCQVSTKTVLRAIQAGRLRASRLGQKGAYRVREIDVDVWIEAAIVEPPAGRYRACADSATALGAAGAHG